jgi:ribonuclease Z
MYFMDKAKVTFLGTGSAIPTAKRNHIGILVSYRDENLLFDCGEGIQRQFRIAKLNPGKVNRIFISHWHGDHVLGLPGLLQTFDLNGKNGELIIYGPQGSKKRFQELIAPHLKFYWDISRKNGNKIDIKVKEVGEGVVLEEKDFKVEAIETDHGCRGLTYSFTVKSRKRMDAKKLKKLGDIKGPVIGELAAGKKVKIKGKIVDGGKLIYEEPERKIAFILDSRMKKEFVSFIKGSDILASEATYFDDDELANEHGHMTAMQAVSLAKKAKVGKLLLFHFSQRLEAIMRDVEKGVKKGFKESVLCRDFDSFEF